MAIHKLKTDPKVFAESWSGRKCFEIRKDDRDFQVGDILVLNETKYSGEEMQEGMPLMYTGRTLEVEISYKLPVGDYGLNFNWTVLSVVKIKSPESEVNKKLSSIHDLAIRGDVTDGWALEHIRNMF